MKLTADRKKLLDALQSVSVAILTKGNGANPYGNYVLLRCVDGKLNIVADSIALRAESTVECEIKTPGTALVSYPKLAALLQRNDFADVGLDIENNRLLVRLGSDIGNTSIPLMPADAFPADRGGSECQAFLTLDGKLFAYAISVACKCAGDGKRQAWNDNVFIKDDGKDLMITACDGRKFAKITLPSCGTEFKAVIPAALIQSCASSMKGEEAFSMFIYAGSVRFATENLELITKQAEAAYVERITELCNMSDAQCKESVTISRDRLLCALNTAAAQLAQDDFGGLKIEIATNRLRVTANAADGGEHREDIECKASKPFPTHQLNREYFMHMVAALDCENVTLHYDVEDKMNAPRITAEGSTSVSLYPCWIRL